MGRDMTVRSVRVVTNGMVATASAADVNAMTTIVVLSSVALILRLGFARDRDLPNAPIPTGREAIGVEGEMSA